MGRGVVCGMGWQHDVARGTTWDDGTVWGMAWDGMTAWGGTWHGMTARCGTRDGIGWDGMTARCGTRHVMAARRGSMGSGTARWGTWCGVTRGDSTVGRVAQHGVVLGTRCGVAQGTVWDAARHGTAVWHQQSRE